MEVTEIVRGMSQKVNLSKYGSNFAYETRDYYASVKVSVNGIEEAIEASKLAQEMCAEEIKKDILALDSKMKQLKKD